MTTIVTLQLDPASQARFNRLREQHYPPHLNRIAAHITLFHALPDTEEIRAALVAAAQSLGPFPVHVNRVMSLGRGVAYALESPTLHALHANLAKAFQSHLTRQDQQGFRPHIVVQNKASGTEAKALHAELTTDFTPWEIAAEGLEWWNYLNGPWELRERFPFAKVQE